MFTSRAEYRILLRQDNADDRLTLKSYELGSLVTNERMLLYREKELKRTEIIQFLSQSKIKPEQINPLLERLQSSVILKPVKIKDILLRPEVRFKGLIEEVPFISRVLDGINLGVRKEEIIESAEIYIKYQGYITREKLIADKLQRLEHITLSSDLNYSEIKSLSTEARQKLDKLKPDSIGKASRIPGVSPADINVLLILLGR
jgi:tRNA uridine 5-carboxymethylaminomethyl modification enzyme